MLLYVYIPISLSAYAYKGSANLRLLSIHYVIVPGLQVQR